MSRIGNQILTIADGVTFTCEDNVVTVKGPKGELTQAFNKKLEITHENGTVTVKRPNDSKEMRSLHGTTGALIKNMLKGVTEGFKKELEMVGVGYRAQLAGNTLTIQAGYSHPIEMVAPEGVSIEVPKNTQIILTGIDKQVVGEFAANIRAVRPPEPYKGKGIKYVDEQIIRKEGKKA